MTDLHGGRAASAGESEFAGRLKTLAGRACPERPAGRVGALLNRILVYARPNQVPFLRPYVSTERSGFVLAGAKAKDRMQSLDDANYEGVALWDPAAYETYTATVDAPFQLPKNQLLPMSLDDVLDQQLVAGGAAALTPTGYIPAGDTDALKAAVGQVKQLRRTDVIFVVPLDVSLLGRAFIRQTTAILADADCPVGLVLGRQYDPLAQDTARIIPNLRTLAATVDLMPLRTDFNALDLVAHGAFAGAIGTGGTVRHTINPEEKSLARIKDQSPSVLFPELVCWWKGSKIADLYGARPGPRCGCAVCDEQQLTRFLRRTHQNEAHAHAVAVWEQWAGYMLEKPTMKDRAEFWRTLCASSLQEHQFITHRLQRKEPLKPQKPVEVWATLPAWPDS